MKAMHMHNRMTVTYQVIPIGTPGTGKKKHRLSNLRQILLLIELILNMGSYLLF